MESGAQGSAADLGSRQRIARSLVACMPLLLSVPPFLGVVYMVARCGYCFPFWDQWDALVPQILKAFEGTLTFSDLTTRLNGHVIFLPRAIMVGLAWLTRWDHRAELALNVILGAALFAAVAWMVRATARRACAPLFQWYAPIAACFVFSMVQWEIWVFGFHILILLCLSSVAAGLALLSEAHRSRLALCGAIVAGICASLSHGAGIAFWPAGLIVLAMGASGDSRRAVRVILFWAVLGGSVIVALYGGRLVEAFFGGEAGQGGSWLGRVRYCFVFMGASVVNWRLNNMLVAAGVGLAAWLAAAAYLLCAAHVPRVALAPWAAWGGYAWCSALVAACMRSESQGVAHATSSRFTGFSIPFWISLFALLFLVRVLPAGPANRRIAWASRGVALGLLAVFACFEARSTLEGARYAIVRWESYQPAVQELYHLENAELLRRLYPDADCVREQTQHLRHHRLSIFRHEASADAAGAAPASIHTDGR